MRRLAWEDFKRRHPVTTHTTTPAAGRAQTEPQPVQKRLNINMNEQTAAALRELAQREQISITEAVRRAISIYKFFSDELADGRKIQTMREDGGAKRDVVLM